MGLDHSPLIVTDGLSLYTDAVTQEVMLVLAPL